MLPVCVWSLFLFTSCFSVFILLKHWHNRTQSPVQHVLYCAANSPTVQSVTLCPCDTADSSHVYQRSKVSESVNTETKCHKNPEEMRQTEGLLSFIIIDYLSVFNTFVIITMWNVPLMSLLVSGASICVWLPAKRRRNRNRRTNRAWDQLKQFNQSDSVLISEIFLITCVLCLCVSVGVWWWWEHKGSSRRAWRRSSNSEESQQRSVRLLQPAAHQTHINTYT